MPLCVIYHNCSRPAIERTRIEIEYRDSLLELTNGIENAAHCRDVHYKVARHSRYPTDWSRFCKSAFAHATRNLTEPERKLAFFTVKLIPRR